jgi:hypothetical protein
MAGIFTDYWRIVKPAPVKTTYNASPEETKFFNNFSWYTKVMKGASSRNSKYTQYKGMDTDVFVARALDTIAEEMTNKNTKTHLPFDINYQNEVSRGVNQNITDLVRAALRHWCEIQDLNHIVFDIARVVIKYGDCFFRKTSDFKKWIYLDPQDVIGVVLDKDTNRPSHYHLRTGAKNEKGAFGDVEIVPAAGIIHFTLSSGMGESGPFGESVLFPVVKAYRHLTLLEDSVIIYRIVRAPERRVFFIDTGNMPPQRVKSYLESIKNEVRQKRVPNESGGQEKIDSVYNPMSMTEDYFFAQSANGRGSRVETLSGGENLGEISDLNYFQNKLLQGLRIPSSYMRGSSDQGGQVSDGKVGVAYIEELRFANFVSRLQQKINRTFDGHFKAYLKSAGLNVDPQLFNIELPAPQDFDIYKQAEVDEKLMSIYGNVKDIEAISTRYALIRYLNYTEDDLKMNESLLRQERNIPDGGIAPGLDDIRMMYDKKWQEGRPDIKVSDDYDNYEEETSKPKAPDSEGEDTDSETPEGEDTEGEDTQGDESQSEDTSEDKDKDKDDTGTEAEDSEAESTKSEGASKDDNK